MNRPLGAILTRAIEKASILLSKPEQNVVEIEMEKAILTKAQLEMGNISLHNRGKAVLFIKWQRTELCSCSNVLWKLELASNEVGYLAEAVSRQRVAEVARFFLTI